jgi:hypothetical protein
MVSWFIFDSGVLSSTLMCDDDDQRSVETHRSVMNPSNLVDQH